MRTSILLVFGAATFGAGCDDGFGPQLWDDTPVDAVIFSAARPDLIGLPSAYDVVLLRSIRIEEPGATTNWDFALGELDGQMVFLPAGLFPGISSRAGIAPLPDADFEDLEEAPRDTAAFTARPVEVVEGRVYAVRSRRAQCPSFAVGVMYAKILVREIDVERGQVDLSVVRNPFCDLRTLVPPD